MDTLYEKPSINSFSAADIVEKIGPCQTQYTTLTLHTKVGSSGVNIDGTGLYRVGVGYFLTITDDNLTTGYNYSNPFQYLERSYVGFDISALPSNSTVVSASLRIYQIYVYDSTYSTLGNMVVDHINFGSSLGAEDWDGGTITSNVGAISNSATVEWKSLDVKTAVETDISAGRTSSQFRIRFSPTENPGGTDRRSTFCASADVSYGGNIPELVITYK